MFLFSTPAICRSERNTLKEFKEFLSIPNIAADTANIRRNADWLVKAMQAQA